MKLRKFKVKWLCPIPQQREAEVMAESFNKAAKIVQYGDEYKTDGEKTILFVEEIYEDCEPIT